MIAASWATVSMSPFDRALAFASSTGDRRSAEIDFSESDDGMKGVVMSW